MIGVISKEEDARVTAEFFELFKTPWEPHQLGHAYPVVLSTGELPGTLQASLVIVAGSAPIALDDAWEVRLQPPRAGGQFHLGDNGFPLYGRCSPRAVDNSVSATQQTGSDPLVSKFTWRSLRVVRLGYDLFNEIRHLLEQGQPPEHAHLATLEAHVECLRRLILEAGLPVVELPARPPGRALIACLTHDIDFLRLRHHRGDRTMWGFLYRATVGSVLSVVSNRIPVRRLFANLMAVLKLPLVYADLCRDFWIPFESYLDVEKGRPSTFFLIPHKHRNGIATAGVDHRLRATKYDVEDVASWIPALQDHGNEVTLHGIDAWHDLGSARAEKQRLASFSNQRPHGVRMHWLRWSGDSAAILDAAGFDYDSTSGYNDAVGFRNGTAQAFRPLTARRLLELPMLIQDTAMFYPGRMHLREDEARRRCEEILQQCSAYGGAITINWHDRSLVPERLWGEFYRRLIVRLDQAGAWFATASDAVAWFRHRRAAAFLGVIRSPESMEVHVKVPEQRGLPSLAIRITQPLPDGRFERSEHAIPPDGCIRVPLKSSHGVTDGHGSVSPTRRWSSPESVVVTRP